jgi:glycerol uptake facilitator-like aquaporin
MSLPRRLFAEFLGTAALVMVVIGSGLMGQRLSADLGVVILINQIGTVLGLAVLVALLIPVSGAHINPAVTLVMTLRRELSASEGLSYGFVQLAGGVAGAVGAQAMFDLPLVEFSDNQRLTTGSFLSEVISTAGLIAVILTAVAQSKAGWLPLLVPAWIGAGFFATSSTSFANPAVTVGRMFTDSFTGIAVESVLGFIAAQVLGALLGWLLVSLYYPTRLAREAQGEEASRANHTEHTAKEGS